MPHAQLASGITIEYETFGSPNDPPLLLVMGFTAQMVAWHDGFVQRLVDGGRFVIRFDNRDCGLSTKIDGRIPDIMAVISAALSDQPDQMPPVPYTLSDMAADAIGLLDHLSIDRAHIVGASMGGMIAQIMAIEYPQRVITLTSVMSQPGDPDVGQPTAEAAAILLSQPATDRESYIDSSAGWMVWHSKKYRNEQRSRDEAAALFDRSFYPEGALRQMAAIYASGRRGEQLSQLDVATLVVHGRDDTLISPSGGLRTAELIPGAHLLYLADMGHDLPEPLWPMLCGSILIHTQGS